MLLEKSGSLMKQKVTSHHGTGSDKIVNLQIVMPKNLLFIISLRSN